MKTYQLDTYIVLRHALVSDIWLPELLAVLVGGELAGNDVVERVQPKLMESRTHAGVVDEANSPCLSSITVKKPGVRGWFERSRMERMWTVLREPSVCPCGGER